MWYVLLILCGLLAALLLLRLRVRLNFSDTQRLLFVGLGQTGPEFDFLNHTKKFRLFGLPTRPVPLGRTTSHKSEPTTRSSPKPHQRTPRRRRPIREWLPLVPNILSSSVSFLIGLLRSVIIEECSGAIRAGASSPDQTGQLYGCYCAVVGAVPAIGTRFSFEPDWVEGPSFAGSLRLSVALPVYALVFRVLKLLWSLPLGQLYRLSRTQPKGA